MIVDTRRQIVEIRPGQWVERKNGETRNIDCDPIGKKLFKCKKNWNYFLGCTDLIIRSDLKQVIEPTIIKGLCLENL